MLKLIILYLSLTLIISMASINAKDVELLTQFTKHETECTGTNCGCAADGSNPNNWINYHDKTDVPFGPDYHDYEFYQISKVITELSSEGFVLLTDKYHCPPGVEECVVKFNESNIFSVTSNYKKISRMSIVQWNNFLQKNSSPKISTSWYECVFEANTTGYLALHPMVEKVQGWVYNQHCSTSDCWPNSHPCSTCPEEPRANQGDCVWLGKAPKINPADNTIEGERLCVTAENEEVAFAELNNSEGKHSLHPRKYDIIL